MTSRRILIVAALFMGITALAAGLSAPPPAARKAAEQQRERSRGEIVLPVMREVDLAGERAPVVSVVEDDEVRLTVSGATEADVVEIVGLDRLETLGPDTPAMFDLIAPEPGRYPLVLSGDGRTVGVLRVTALER